MYMYTCMYIHAHIFIIIICAYLAGLPQLTISSPDAFNAFLIDRNVRSKTLDEVVLGATRRANLEGRPQSLHLIGLQMSECSGSRTLIALPSKLPAFGGVRNGISE